VGCTTSEGIGIVLSPSDIVVVDLVEDLLGPVEGGEFVGSLKLKPTTTGFAFCSSS